MRRLVLTVLVGGLIGLLLQAPLGADDEPDTARRWLLLGPDGQRLRAVVVSTTERGADGLPVFDPALSGETRTLPAGLLDRVPSAASLPVVWGQGLVVQRIERGPGVVGLRLARAVPFGGTLRFDRGKGAAGVTLLARSAEGADLVHRTRTDEHGVWRFDHVGPGEWVVSVRRGDGRLQSLGVFTAGQPDVERLLVPGSRVEGQLLDGDAPKRTGFGGLRFVLVALPDAVALSEEPYTAKADGTFVLDDVPAGVYEARLVEADHFFEPASPRVEVPARGHVELRGWYALRGRQVTGRVEGPRSARVAGASVLLLPDSTLSPPPGGWPRHRAVRTDAEGRFILGGVRPATGYRLAVSAPGYASTVTTPFDVTGPKPTTVPTVLLASGWRLEARVRAPGGAPLAGIEIHAVPADHPVRPGERGWTTLARRAVTGSDGLATLADLPEGDVLVTASSPHVTDASELVTYPASGDVRTWVATLFPAPRLAGRIEAPAGARLPALLVRATPHGHGAVRTTPVGPTGDFAFAGLGSEPVDLSVVRADVRRGLVLARVEGLIPGRSPPVLLTLPKPASIEGRVRDAAENGPAVRVLLEAPVFEADDDAFRWRTVASVNVADDDPRHRFRFEALSPGTYAVRAVQGDNDSSAQTVRIEESGIEHVDLFLTPGGRVAGTVLDDTARPRLGAEVRLVRLRGDGDAPGRPMGMPRRATDAAGGYVFEDVAPGVWRVEVRDADDAADQETVRVSEGESVIVRDLLLAPGGAVAGVVSDGQGRELDGALLVFESLDDGPDARRTRTGRNGHFHLSGLRAGLWRIRLDARAGPFTALEAVVEVVGEETTEVELTATGRARILGRVWRQGRPVPDLGVYLVSRPGGTAGLARRRTTRTDAEGRFDFDGLPTGAYEVDVADGGVWSTRALTVDDGDVLTLDLEAWEGRLTGEVVGLGGAPIADATVVAQARGAGAEGLRGRVRTDPQGRFHIVGLPVGRYDLSAFAPGLPPGRLLDVLAEVEGAERPVTLTLGEGGTLELRVIGPDGRGVAGARIWLEDEQGGALHGRPYVTGYRGLLRLVGTAPGRLWVRTYARRFGRPARTVVEVGEGEVSTSDIHLPLPARLSVQVEGAGSAGLPRARIELLRLPSREPVVRVPALTRSRLEPAQGRLPRTGAVEYDELGPGLYLVRVDAGRRFEIAEVPYEIGALDDAFLEIDLVRIQ